MKTRRLRGSRRNLGRLARGPAADQGVRPTSTGFSTGPHMAASCKLFGRFSGVVFAAGRRIDNPPDPEGAPANLSAWTCGPPKAMKTRRLRGSRRNLGRLARGPAADQGVRPTSIVRRSPAIVHLGSGATVARLGAN